MKSTSLYTTADVAKVRNLLLQEQEGIDPITGELIPKGQAVLDHCHDSQFVRAVLHRQSNAVLGKLENMHSRYLGWWYDGTLSDFLRGAADYLELDHPQEYYHPGWLKKAKTEFNKLNAGQQLKLLEMLQNDLQIELDLSKTNLVKRKALFAKYLLKKQHNYAIITVLLNKVKEINETNK